LACPALTIYPACAVGCLHGENGMVCSITYPTNGISGIFRLKKLTVFVFQAGCSEKNMVETKESVVPMLYP